MSNVNNEILLIAFVALTGVAVLLQAIILLALYITLRKTTKELTEKVDNLRSTVEPVLTDAKDFLTRVGPKVDAVATNLAEVTNGLRTQSVELQASAADILERLRRQTTRVDAILTGVFDTADRAGSIVSDVLSRPLRQLSAIAASIRAGLGAFRSPSPSTDTHPTHSAADKDMFV
jgi:hypothetical protein